MKRARRNSPRQRQPSKVPFDYYSETTSLWSDEDFHLWKSSWDEKDYPPQEAFRYYHEVQRPRIDEAYNAWRHGLNEDIALRAKKIDSGAVVDD